MLYNNTAVATAVELGALPDAFDDLFAALYDTEATRFVSQESTIIDFKENIPDDFSKDYGAGIVRLALGFYNTYGGLIVFGVKDRSLDVVGDDQVFDIETFNRTISDFSGARIESILKSYQLSIDGAERCVQVVLIPRRGLQKPARLSRAFAKYREGMLWVRERHEVIEAETRHLPLLYSDRAGISTIRSASSNAIHRSLPPSPSTIEDFVGRRSIMQRMWEWLTFGAQPRIYMHGTGGSGKSTLAYEFARSVVESENAIRLSDGGALDYVLYISGKETGFNPIGQNEEAFALRDFVTAREQFTQILFHSGFATPSEILSITDDEIDSRLEELFSSYNGLIIIDDIDALSRRGEETGEEALFLKAAQASARTRILYTLRFAPPYALRSAIEVPGLDPDSEYYDFIETCCRQFGVVHPSAEYILKIGETTDYIPLLVETVVGLRKSCTSYGDALQAFESKGGDGARRYLYQREYDRLGARGKSRQVLAALALLDGAVAFGTLCDVLGNIPESQVRDAISETQGIFLRSQEAENGDTLYEVAAPAVRFVEGASKELPYYDSVSRSVEHFKSAAIRMSTSEAAAFARMTKLYRDESYPEVVEYFKGLPEHDVSTVNPKVIGILGRAYAKLGSKHAEDARERFKQAFALRDKNIFMLRDWFYLEFMAPHTLAEAERLCKELVADKDISKRHRAEFYSKLAMTQDKMARTHIYTNKEKAVRLTIDSINSNLEAAFVGRGIAELNWDKQQEWLTGCVASLFRIMGDDADPVFTLIESWAELDHDIDLDAVKTVIEPIKSLQKIPAHKYASRLSGLAKRAMGKLSKVPRRVLAEPGFAYVQESLRMIANANVGGEAGRG